MIDILGFLVSWLTLLGIYSILALSLNFESGVSGVTNFGKVLFYGVGAYVAAALSTYLLLAIYGIDTSETPPYDIKGIIALGHLSTRNPLVNLGLFALTLILAFLVAGALGYLLTYPILRVGPAFVGFTLLSSGELMRIFLQHYTPLGASKGLMAIPNPFAWVPVPRLREALFLAVVLSLLALVYLVLNRLVNSPFGRALKAVRDDEIAALCLGKHVPRIKATVLFIGSGFSGVAGALLAYYLTAVNPDMFVPAVTFNVWAMIILGGLGNLKGSLVGAAVFTLLDRLLTFVTPQIGLTVVSPDYIRWFAVGLLIVVLIIARPQGLLPEEPVKTPALEEALRAAGESSG
ncbi:MAG: branched-chain amino acid ABC transporter permease [Thermofilum sp.]|uniref:Branched-chain amino acid ABC transporter permease n=1 Tax=Thermofilum pendens TaxID=2269 RepID=A0A7C4D4N5_THEPE